MLDFFQRGNMEKDTFNVLPYLAEKRQRNNEDAHSHCPAELNTYDLVYIPSSMDDKKILVSRSCTDFAHAISMGRFPEEDESAVHYLLRDAALDDTDGVTTVGSNDKIYTEASSSEPSLGLCPCISLKISKLAKDFHNINDVLNIETKKDSNGAIKHFVKLGEYPNSSVSENENILFEDLYNNGKLKQGIVPTDRFFETNIETKDANVNKFYPVQNPEFIINGKKYVRRMVFDFDSKSKKDRARPEWFAVEPISFEITNWDKLPRNINPKGPLIFSDKTIDLISENIILSGIPYFPNLMEHCIEHCTMWQNSLVRTYLNGYPNRHLTPKQENYGAPYWDIDTNGGFINQAFNNQPVKELEIGCNYIGEYAFAGCVNLEKITLSDYNAYTIKKNAFDGCEFKYYYINNYSLGVFSKSLPNTNPKTSTRFISLPVSFQSSTIESVSSLD